MIVFFKGDRFARPFVVYKGHALIVQVGIVSVGHFAAGDGRVLLVSVKIVDLERELGAGVILLVGAADGFAQQKLAVHGGGQVEAHVQVRGAGAAFHVIHLHGMGGVILENAGAGGEDRIQVRLHGGVAGLKAVAFAVVLFKQGAQRRRRGAAVCFFRIGDHDLAGTEVDLADQCGVDAAQVQHKLAVHVQPEVVVARELKDDVVSPGVQAVLALDEACLHLHAEVVDGVLEGDLVKRLAETRVVGG